MWRLAIAALALAALVRAPGAPAGLTLRAASGHRPAAEPVVVFAASSFTNVLEAIDAEFERAAGQRVLLNVGGSNSLARQIAEGAPADVFCSADEPQLAVVERAGKVAARRRAIFALNQLVVMVGGDRRTAPIRTVADLLESSVTRIAVGDPAAVPAGVYTRRFLERRGLWSRLQPKLVPTPNVRAALAAVESGNVDAAFVYATDAPLATRATVAFRVPRDEAPVAHWCARLTGGRNPEAGDRYLQFLESPTAVAIIRRFGFIVPA